MSLQDLEAIVRDMVKTAAKIDVLPPSRPPAEPRLGSYFGGPPYFEAGMNWPRGTTGQPLSFVMQIYNGPDGYLPPEIKLLQFFYDWKEAPVRNRSSGWKINLFEELRPEAMVSIKKPEELGRSKFCEISLSPIKSLPDWEGLDSYSPETFDRFCKLNEDKDDLLYDDVVEKIIGKQDYQSQIGGYPQWVQSDSTPKDATGNPWKLLIQLDSEKNAGLLWGDAGCVYIFYNQASKQIRFTLQSY